MSYGLDPDHFERGSVAMLVYLSAPLDVGRGVPVDRAGDPKHSNILIPN